MLYSVNSVNCVTEQAENVIERQLYLPKDIFLLTKAENVTYRSRNFKMFIPNIFQCRPTKHKKPCIFCFNEVFPLQKILEIILESMM